MKSILLIEDDLSTRTTISNLLERLGDAVIEAEDGTSAIEIASNAEHIDLLLSDMVLPGDMSGIDIYNQIRNVRRELKCLFMTGYSYVTEKELPKGTVLLTKPFSMQMLATNLRLVLDA